MSIDPNIMRNINFDTSFQPSATLPSKKSSNRFLNLAIGENGLQTALSDIRARSLKMEGANDWEKVAPYHDKMSELYKDDIPGENISDFVKGLERRTSQIQEIWKDVK